MKECEVCGKKEKMKEKMNIREKSWELAVFRGCYNAVVNAVMIGEPITSVNWNEKIAPEFRKIEDLIDKLLRKL